ncbi:phospholipid/cholesterol/gamma-HCH transport system substrate-binding protein [Actinomadura luteofluorescens]|uniref:Phospholipid/cholesterol/gamma-HCH transport system substrate-binding protein n=1 Tax=Actinomadura luteofluorescens TaxID=46163 RepID=A0A7Y9ELF9_9ACTN|nr:MCE family protein [Actinomadura luteofluorescens]NYD49877.1 phospholipid/cholesterol/gamma-HCH transport system substrate-binding protein [Actinomadura luteofluorescens]
MRTPKLVAALAAGVLLTAGCSVRLEDVPLPGGADLGDHPYTVKVRFEDVLNLVPQAAVRVNDVPVGRVKKVSLPAGAWQAEVTLVVNGDVHLPANATANLEQSSLLGEKYVRLAAPTAAPSPQRLSDGAVIPASRTTRNADTEEVFGALSLLLSGGGLPQIRTINRELNQALGGREDKVRSALRNLDTFTGTLNRNRRSIVNALDGLNRLSSTVRARNGQVGTVLDDLSPGLKVLEEQRGQLVEMLRRLERLSDVAVKTINASKEDTAANLRSLAVVLRKLADSGRDLPKSLEILLTYPFTDEALKAIKGDYLNAYVTVIAADGFECVVPPVKEEGPFDGLDDEEGARARALAATPTVPGPQPAPCPDTAAGRGSGAAVPGAGTPTAGTPATGAPATGTPRPVTPSRAPGNESPSSEPALPLPTLGEGN